MNQPLESQAVARPLPTDPSWPSPEARAVLDAMTDYFIAMNRAYDVVFVNRALTESMREGSPSLLGINQWQMYPEMRGTIVEESYERAFNLQIPVNFEYHHEKSGYWLSIAAYPHDDLLHVFFKDITAMRLAEKGQRERENLLRSIVDSIPQIAWAMDEKMVMAHLNRRWYEYAGVPEDSPLDTTHFVHPDDLGDLQALWRSAPAAGVGFEGEARLLRHDGEYRWHLIRVEPQRDGDRILGWFGTSTDVHDRKLADERLVTITNAVPAFISYLDTNLVYRFCNRRYEEWYGLPLPQIVGRHIRDVTGERNFEIIEPLLERALGGEIVRHEDWLEFPRGKRFMRFSYLPEFGPNGEVTGINKLLSDETDVKRDREALAEARLRTEGTLASADVGTWILHTDTNHVYSDTNLVRMFGLEDDHGEGRHVSEYIARIHPDDRPHVFEALSESLSTGTRYDVEYRIVNGSTERWVTARGVPEKSPDGIVLRLPGVIVDVTRQKASEAALRDSELRFRSLADNIDPLSWVADADGSIFWYSQRWYDSTGTTPEEMEGWGWQSVHDPEWLPRVLDVWKRSIASGMPFSMEFPLRGADGKFRNFLTRVNPIRDETGNVVRWFGTNTDVSALREGEERLRQTQESLGLAMKGGRMGWWSRDLATEEVRWSPELEEMFGLEVGSFRGEEERFLHFVHPDDRSAVTDAVGVALRDGTDYSVEFRFRREDGVERWMEGRGRATYGPSGPVALFGLGIDITDRKEAARRLEESEARLRLALDAAAMGTWDCDLVSGITKYSDKVGPIFGKDRAPFALDLADWKGHIHPDDEPVVLASLKGLLDRDAPYKFSTRVIGSDGVTRWVDVNGAVVRGEDGRPLRALGVIADITERRQAEDAIREGEVMMRSVLRTVVEGVVVLDPQGRVILSNPAFEELHAIDGERFQGFEHFARAFDMIDSQGGTIAPEDGPAARALRGERVEGIDARVRRKDTGAEFWAAYSAAPVTDDLGGVTAVVVTVAVITARVEAEQEARRSEQRLRRILEAATIGVVVNSPEGVFTYANAPLLQILGYSREDVADGTLTWARIQDPELKPRDDMAHIQLLATGSCEPYETMLVRKNGSRVPVYMGAALVPDEGGDGVLGAAFVTDLTETKLAEAQLLSLNEDLERRVELRTEELTRANRDLNEFSCSVAHDLRAPLRAIVATSKILIQDAEDRLMEEERELLARQATNALRLARLVDDLLGFARLSKADLRREEFDLSALARATGDEMARRYDGVCMVEVKDGMIANGDPSLIGYALANLLDNACKFSPAGGTVRVGEEGGDYFVRDEGVGFDMVHAHKLFIAFERLVDQESFAGTGVGLANVKRIIERHGGRIWAHSEPGRGSTFRFTLP